MFILYFVIAAIITTVCVHMGVNAEAFKPMKELSKFMIIMAMAAIGLNSNMVQLIKTGGKPIIVGASCWNNSRKSDHAACDEDLVGKKYGIYMWI